MASLSFSQIKTVSSLTAQSPFHLLAISDEQDRLNQIWEGHENAEAEVISPSQVSDMLAHCRDEFKIVILDVVSAKIGGLLKALRENPKCKEALILVSSSRLPAGPELCGVLPHFRAMPCNWAEMKRLVEFQQPGAKPQAAARGVL